MTTIAANYETAVTSISQCTECLCVQICSKLIYFIRVRVYDKGLCCGLRFMGHRRVENRTQERAGEVRRDLIFVVKLEKMEIEVYTRIQHDNHTTCTQCMPYVMYCVLHVCHSAIILLY